MQAFMLFNLLPIWFKILTIATSGSIIGSFLSLVSYRVITKEPMVFARSKCTNCHKTLKARNLIPIFSWLFSKGKCGSCHISISWRYPLIELACVLVFLLVLFANNFQISWTLILHLMISTTLVFMCITDLEHYFIPNQSQFILAIFVAILTLIKADNIANIDFLNNIKGAFILLIFAFALLGFFYITTKKQAMGVDDIKFFFIAGFAIGMKQILLFTMLSGLTGVIFGLLWKAVKKEGTFPFAPAMCVSLFIIMLFGDKIDLFDIASYLIFGI